MFNLHRNAFNDKMCIDKGVYTMKLKRESYLSQIRPYYESDIIKVITGVRRSGKSVLLESIRDELIQNGIKGDHIIYLNLEDLDFTLKSIISS